MKISSEVSNNLMFRVIFKKMRGFYQHFDACLKRFLFLAAFLLGLFSVTFLEAQEEALDSLDRLLYRNLNHVERIRIRSRIAIEYIWH